MKVAIFGASGIVGRSLRALLTKNQVEWIGTYNTNPFEGGIQLNTRDITQLRNFLESNKITHCVNCVAERNVDVCEKQWEHTLSTNCCIAEDLAKACNEMNIYFLHISTDYVFDGSEPPYLPERKHSPIQAYGKSKSMAEEAVTKANPNACIIRVPVLYTQRYNTLNETAVTMIGKKVMDTTKHHVEDNYYIRRPVFIDDFCEFIYMCLLENKQSIYHFYNSKDKTTKYGIASQIARYLDKPISHIEPHVANTHQAGRPYDTHLQDTGYDRSSFPDTSLEEGIEKCFSPYKHPRLNLGEKPSERVFYMIDLDGTLIDTDKLHYEAYKKAFAAYGKELCSWDIYQLLPSFENYSREVLGSMYESMKEEKQLCLYKESTIQFMPGAEIFLQWLIHTNQNFVVVTNTSKSTVDFFKSKLPLLASVSQWITREDVAQPKPNGEPYKKAIELFSKEESYRIGIENTLTGYLSLKEVTSCIYLLVNELPVPKELYEKDAYFIRSLTEIFNKI